MQSHFTTRTALLSAGLSHFWSLNSSDVQVNSLLSLHLLFFYLYTLNIHIHCVNESYEVVRRHLVDGARIAVSMFTKSVGQVTG